MYDKEKRSTVMRNIKGKGNKSTELALIAIFREQGINGWRRGYPVKGHPDFVFLKERIAIFVDGCFWHGHDCRNTHPKNNEEFWLKKIGGNIQRDKDVTWLFINRGWTVIRIWECELKRKNKAMLDNKLKPIFEKLP
ncbi:MAG: very short patch repair endonuclease [Lacrimispora sp.]|uniref:very short patch repair endonuclease n=1 Tax=Lacrimispora sp. TaxID=2719234 RepID=UPI0039E636BB